MIEFLFNGQQQSVPSLDDLELALDRYDQEEIFELWVSAPNGPSMCMLRNGQNAWLMYLGFVGDSGFTSMGNQALDGFAPYTLSNGQSDEYPLSWCIKVEQCFKAITYFFVNSGAKPEWVSWRES